MVCTGIAAGLGILIKGGNILESASKITAIVFDKTGTLTEGSPSVDEVETYEHDLSEEEITYIAAICEAESEHPLGKVISTEFLNKLQKDSLDNLKNKFTLVHFDNLNGEGISCNLKITDEMVAADKSTFDILIGNEKLLQRFAVKISSAAQKRIQEMEEEGKTVIQVVINSQIAMVVALQEKHL